jgi:uncharacterized membrane protein YbaN (DUF454 family)
MKLKKVIKLSVGWILLILAILLFICGVIILSPFILLYVVCEGIRVLARSTTAFIKESFDDALTSFFDGIVRIVMKYAEFKEKYNGNAKKKN